ncbi:GNAT family N-acetyltransferase [Paenirhodobacter enshiensis]|uniref:GNAT family N-acetyltransferase n=1 Tax=Paenirhodobacter enshiensis TaxID=1105367 RepID=UPI000691C365|nr:GNAT family N-acyltransferase [Paenirhodobacter enshiensis]
MQPLSTGRYRVRLAQSERDLAAAQALRGRVFRTGAATDRDDFDAICRHVLVEDGQDRLMCCFRLLPLPGGAAIGTSYSAQFYDLAALSAFAAPMIEVGRFCLAPGCHDPDVLRLAWGALASEVAAQDAGMLFGCSSFHGLDWRAYADCFAALAGRHLAPERWRPQAKAPQLVHYAQALAGQIPDLRRAQLTMPPLLRSYLAMGGWVSDHAVVDEDLGTLHVFTGLEIAAIPPARARVLRMGAVPVSGAGSAGAGPIDVCGARL